MGKGAFQLSDIGAWNKEIIGVLCCLVCCGPVLITVGVFLLVSANDDTRTPQIASYNAVVEEWNEHHLLQFQQASFYVTDNSGNLLKLLADTSPDYLIDREHRVSKYPTLKYMRALEDLLPKQRWNPSSYRFYFYSNASHDTVVIPNSFSQPANIMARQARRPADLQCTINQGDDQPCLMACNMFGGKWDAMLRVCTIDQVLAGLYMKVSLPEVSVMPFWGIDYSYGGPGSDPGPDRRWEVESYLPHFNVSKNVTFTGKIEIRSIRDPYVYAAFITNGSFNFGPSVEQKMTAGILVTICGILIMLPMSVLLYCTCHHKKRFTAQEAEERAFLIQAPVQAIYIAPPPTSTAPSTTTALPIATIPIPGFNFSSMPSNAPKPFNSYYGPTYLEIPRKHSL